MGQTSRKVIALIPLRGGSKSIPLKNIKVIAGRPLAYWALDAACGCDLIDRVYVSTDSDVIADTIKAYANEKVEIIGRSKESALDTASTESVMLEFANKVDFTDIVLIQATSPLIESIHLEEGLNSYFKSKADSLVSVVRQKRFLWEKSGDFFFKPLNYDPLKRPRRQDWSGQLVENGAFYITSKISLTRTSSRISGNTICYEMPEYTYMELDEPSDWDIMENILLKRKSGKYGKPSKNRLSRIKLLVLDVDGVLTDAGMYYGEKGEELKKFNTRDGKGIELVRQKGIKVAFITGERSLPVQKRAEKLSVDSLFQGVTDKITTLKELVNSNGMILENVAYIGDDINDLDAMKEAGFSATPADGARELKSIADYICLKNGGQGCVREVCDLLIEAKI
jgi:YrbI family 3-deoxy-D-manno-octulosonate 8-phosphate phosphatase